MMIAHLDVTSCTLNLTNHYRQSSPYRIDIVRKLVITIDGVEIAEFSMTPKQVEKLNTAMLQLGRNREQVISVVVLERPVGSSITTNVRRIGTASTWAGVNDLINVWHRYIIGEELPRKFYLHGDGEKLTIANPDNSFYEYVVEAFTEKP